MALDLTDKTGNGNTLTNNNTATEVTSSLPFAASTKAADLEASSSQYFSASDSVSLSVTGNLTLEMWVKFESLPGSGSSQFLITKRAGAGSRGYRLRLFNNSGTYQLTCSISDDGTNEVDVAVNWTPSTATWYHVAVVYTAAGGTADFYVDGSQQGTQQSGLPTSIYNNTVDLQIGAQEASNFIDGVIDDVRIWAAARTGSEVNNNKSLHLTGSETNLKGYWPFEEIATFTPQVLMFL